MSRTPSREMSGHSFSSFSSSRMDRNPRRDYVPSYRPSRPNPLENQDPQRRMDERLRETHELLRDLRLLSGQMAEGDDYERLLTSFPIITRGTPAERVEMFPRWKYEPPKAGSEASRNEERTRCNICLEDFARGDNVLSLPCFHIYHEDCIVHWLKEHKTCPVCRKDCTEDERI